MSIINFYSTRTSIWDNDLEKKLVSFLEIPKICWKFRRRVSRSIDSVKIGKLNGAVSNEINFRYAARINFFSGKEIFDLSKTNITRYAVDEKIRKVLSDQLFATTTPQEQDLSLKVSYGESRSILKDLRKGSKSVKTHIAVNTNIILKYEIFDLKRIFENVIKELRSEGLLSKEQKRKLIKQKELKSFEQPFRQILIPSIPGKRLREEEPEQSSVKVRKIEYVSHLSNPTDYYSNSSAQPTMNGQYGEVPYATNSNYNPNSFPYYSNSSAQPTMNGQYGEVPYATNSNYNPNSFPYYSNSSAQPTMNGQFEIPYQENSIPYNAQNFVSFNSFSQGAQDNPVEIDSEGGAISPSFTQLPLPNEGCFESEPQSNRSSPSTPSSITPLPQSNPSSITPFDDEFADVFGPATEANVENDDFWDQNEDFFGNDDLQNL